MNKTQYDIHKSKRNKKIFIFYREYHYNSGMKEWKMIYVIEERDIAIFGLWTTLYNMHIFNTYEEANNHFKNIEKYYL